MESDLRLLEISGEDDSLLTPLPHMDDTNPNEFTPFSNFISPLRGLEGRVDPVKPGCSSSYRRGCSNKDNINTDKAEVPKLSIEPLHMKRKKRGGGYNLRKSLAWDRAFSTEEGVLDPIELSLLSGTLVNTCGDPLFTINEEERNPTSNDSLRDASSAYLNSNKKSMLKEIRSVALKEDKRKASSKMLASRNGRSVSKYSGCPRPLASPSLKRPANMNHGKSATKDSKLPKFQVSKPSSCSLPTSSKSIIPRTSHLKHQVTDSAVSTRKNAGLRSSSRKVSNSQEKAKPDAEPLKDKCSSCIFRGNDKKSTSKLHASTESSPPVNKATSTALEMNPDATVSSSRAHSSQSHDGCTPFALRLPQSTLTAVSSMQYLPAQAMKPSGLRMPSPSLGYFCQTKASDTRRLLKPESSMCPSERSGDRRPPEALETQESKVNLANLNCRILGLESESSTASCKVIKTSLEGDSVERSNVSSVIMKLDPVSDKLRNPADNVDEKLPHHIEHEEKKLQDAELLMKGKQHPPQTGKHEHINKDDLMNSIPGFKENKSSAGSDFREAYFTQARYNAQSLVLCGLEGATSNPNEAEESGICSVTDGSICSSQYGNMINFSGEVREEGYIGSCNNLPGKEFEKVKSFAAEDEWIFDNDEQIMKMKSNLNEAHREPRYNGSGNCESLDLTCSDFSEEKMLNSEVASQHEDCQNLNQDFAKQITDRAQTGGLVVEVSNETLSDENCKTNPGEVSIYSEHKSQGRNVLHSGDQSLGKHVSIDQSQDGQIAETGLSVSPYRQDEHGFDRFDVKSAQPELESNNITAGDPADILYFGSTKVTLAENCNPPTDEEFNHNKFLGNLTSCLEFGSSSSVTTDEMVSAVTGSIGECRKPIKESVLEAVDEAEIRDSSNCQNEGNLTSSVEHGSSSRGTPDVTGLGILGPMGEGNKLIKDVFLLEEMDEFEIRDSPNKPNDGNQIIKMKHGMLSPLSLNVEESQMCRQEDFIPSSPTELGYHKVVLEILITPPQLGDKRQANEVGKTTNALTNILQMEDTHLELHADDAQLLPGKGPIRRESSNALENFQDALPAQRSFDKGALESPSVLNKESPLIHGSSNVADELDVIHGVEDRLSYPVTIESLSLELNSSTSKIHSASVTNGCIQLVEGDQTSSRIKRKVVDILNQDIVVKESETGKPSGSENSHNELFHGLQDTKQCRNDNTNLPVKNTENCLKKGNLLILPLRDAVPFSDEWLAAMEAAGEDILTMKGGAVQNSPQEKSLPEPSPWSPVKKKNNQLGPFDCTKFNHNMPPES